MGKSPARRQRRQEKQPDAQESESSHDHHPLSPFVVARRTDGHMSVEAPQLYERTVFCSANYRDACHRATRHDSWVGRPRLCAVRGRADAAGEERPAFARTIEEQHALAVGMRIVRVWLNGVPAPAVLTADLVTGGKWAFLGHCDLPDRGSEVRWSAN
jgi:hypothetical protein